MSEHQSYAFRDMSLDIEARLDDLMSRLTIEEKFFIMSGTHIFNIKGIKRLGIKGAGTTDGPIGLGFHSAWRRCTAFPATIGLAASWNRDISSRYGVAAGQEVRSVGRHILLAPGFNILRTPMGGRTFEYLSEDPYLNKEMVIPFVKGIQSERISCCCKHYAANNQETDRFHVDSIVDERTLEEIYLYAFKEVVKEADPWSIMACYNRVNGLFGSEHPFLLKEKLMEEWGFSGFVMSDWIATRNIEKPELAIKAGLSLEMPKPIIYGMKRIQDTFVHGKFNEKELNELIRRFLRTLMRTGLYDEPKTLPKGSRNTPEHFEVARKIAAEGMVLLKNENDLLPLDLDKIKTLAVLGPNKSKKLYWPFLGGSSAVWPIHEISPLKGIKQKCKGKVRFAKKPEEITTADAVILVMGLNHGIGNDAEGADKKSFSLPQKQIDLINSTVKSNPKTIVVLISGSPIAMDGWLENVPSVLEAWYPGMEGGYALADILFGDITPSGKLPVTFPKKLSDSPAHVSERTFPGVIVESTEPDKDHPDHKWKDRKVYYDERIYVGYRHFDTKDVEPLFPFGYGLSYTTFKLDNLKVSKKTITKDDILIISLDITNTGSRDGAEVVQLYVQDLQCSVDRPVKELKGFQKVALNPGEKKNISMELLHKDLQFYDVKSHQWIAEKGKFKILVGTSSRDIKCEEEFELV